MSSLREKAEAATPGPWKHDGAECDAVITGVAVVQFGSDAEFIATFDPPTVLALLDVAKFAGQMFGGDFFNGYAGLREALARLPEEVRRG